MDAEEKVKKEFWFVLKKIKEISLKTPASEYIKYWTHSVILPPAGVPSQSDEGSILRKLQEMGILKLKKPHGVPDYM